MKQKLIVSLMAFTVFLFMTSIFAKSTFASATTDKTIGKEKLKYAIYTEDYPPFSYQEKGKLKGISVEIVQEIIKRLPHSLGLQGLKINFQEWDIAYKKALNTPGTIIFSLTRTPQRENSFKWVGSIAKLSMDLFGLKDTLSNDKNIPINIKSPDDAKKYSIGVQNQSATHLFLKSEGFKKLDISSTPEVVADKLFTREIQLWGEADLVVYSVLKKLGKKPGDLKKYYAIQPIKLYIGFNKETPDSIVQEFQNALDGMKKDGTYDTIVNRYYEELMAFSGLQ